MPWIILARTNRNQFLRVRCECHPKASSPLFFFFCKIFVAKKKLSCVELWNVKFIYTQMGCCKIFQKMIYCAKLTSHNKTIVSLNVAGREGARNLFIILSEQLNFPYNRVHFKHYCILHKYRHFEFTYQRQFFFVHSK